LPTLAVKIIGHDQTCGRWVIKGFEGDYRRVDEDRERSIAAGSPPFREERQKRGSDTSSDASI